MDYILTPDGKLMHCDLSGLNYIDLDEDEICHFKYIKRVKLPNGKWRYYYEDSALDSKAQSLNRARNNLLGAGVRAAAAKDEYNKAQQKNLYKSSKTSVKNSADLYKKVQTAKSNYDKASAARSKAEDNVKTAERNYKKEKIKDLPRKLISQGTVYIANLLEDHR